MQQLQIQHQQYLQQQLRDRSATIASSFGGQSTAGVTQTSPPPVTTNLAVPAQEIRLSVADSDVLLEMLQNASKQQQPPAGK